MKQSLYVKCKKKLQEMKKDYEVILNRETSKNIQSPEKVEQATNTIFFENSMRFRHRMSVTLNEINDALQRIKNGNFGICEKTGETIEEKRLLRIPWARVSAKYLKSLENSEYSFVS